MNKKNISKKITLKKILIIIIMIIISILIIIFKDDVLSYIANEKIFSGIKNILYNFINISLLVAVITSGVSFYTKKYEVDTPNSYKILKKQYNNIFVPLHKAIFLNKTKTKRGIIDEAIEITKENYNYAPYKLIQYMYNRDELIKNDTYFFEYCEYIKDTFDVLRKNLNYYNAFKDSKNIELTVSFCNLEEYIIKYYYDNKLNNEKTEILQAQENFTINESCIKENIETNMDENYSLDKIENIPLIVKKDLNDNVIKVYYKKKGTPKKSTKNKKSQNNKDNSKNPNDTDIPPNGGTGISQRSNYKRTIVESKMRISNKGRGRKNRPVGRNPVLIKNKQKQIYYGE